MLTWGSFYCFPHRCLLWRKCEGESVILGFSSTKRGWTWRFLLHTWLGHSTTSARIHMRGLNGDIESTPSHHTHLSLSFPGVLIKSQCEKLSSPCPAPPKNTNFIGRTQSWLINIYIGNISYVVWANYRLILMGWKLTTELYYELLEMLMKTNRKKPIGQNLNSNNS